MGVERQQCQNTTYRDAKIATAHDASPIMHMRCITEDNNVAKSGAMTFITNYTEGVDQRST